MQQEAKRKVKRADVVGYIFHSSGVRCTGCNNLIARSVPECVEAKMCFGCIVRDAVNQKRKGWFKV